MPYKRYYVSNAYVKPVKQGYEVGDYQFAWTLYATTSVHPVDEAVPPPIPYDFQFKQFSEMFRCADREAPINIKGFIVEAFAEKAVGRDLNGQLLIAQDYVVVDNDKTPMIMRLWKEKIREYADLLSNDLPDAIMFVGMNMKVTTFNGLTLSSRLNSVFLKEPVIHEASSLKEWYNSNKKDVEDLVSGMAYTDTNMLFKKPSPEDVMTITAAMEAIEAMKTAWIAGKLRLIQGQEKFWYMSCKNCCKALKPGHEREMPCPSCDENNPIVVKCHIGVLISDESGTAYAEIYSPDAEMLIPYTAMQLKEAEEQGRSLVSELEAALENKHVVCYIKYFNKLVRGAITRKYPFVKVYLYKDVFPNVEQLPNEAKTTAAVADEVVDLTKDSEENVHFFTPSTKFLIEEISASSQATDAGDATASGCKRVLAFDDAEKSNIVVKLEPVDDDDMLRSMLLPSAFVQSPIKKTKGKLKQN